MIVEDQQHTYDYKVEAEDSAKAVAFDSKDRFPEVLATARMVALMEIASARLMEPLLKPGQLSVGVAVDIVHQAATPVGETVTITSTYKGLTGKLHSFEVEVADDGGIVGRGVHSRAVIDAQRLQTSAAKRVAEGRAKK